ncbi:MAG: hypothetical protein FWF85_04270 [Clostridiales bacterium]|nr:hypothetical protein [Clostridiales bacterium]
MPDQTAIAAGIKCEGNPLPPQVMGARVEIMVESRLDLPGSFCLTFADPSLDFIDKAKGSLREGIQLEISLGYEKDLKTLITGEISTVGAEMSSLGSYVRVAGYDLLHRLARGTNFRHYESSDSQAKATSDSRIAEELAKAVGLNLKFKETLSRDIPRSQDNRSDMDFIVMLARLNGYYLYCEGNDLFFTDEAPDRGELNFTWGKDLISFYPRLCLDGMVKTLENRGRDVSLADNYFEKIDRADLAFLSAEGQAMLNRGSGGRSSKDRSILNLYETMVGDANDAKPFITGFMRDHQALVTAGGSCKGNQNLRAGAKLKIDKAGRFSGTYLVTRAVHRINSSGYITEFDLRMNL